MTRIIWTDKYDPYFNLALEETLLHSCEIEQDTILYLWQNDNTVVIGRNQNAYTECDIKYLKYCHTKMARRLTGGGAVYHDLGNLNFTVITPKKDYDITRSFHVVIKAVNRCGIHAELSGRNDILAEGLKFSGNAFYSNEVVGLHHGTIMVNSDLKQMSRLLNASQGKIRRKGIASVESRVVNLIQLNPYISCNQIKHMLEQEFLQAYSDLGITKYGLNITELKAANKLFVHYASPEWNYGFVREYAMCFQKQFSWGFVEIQFELDGNQLKKIFIASDSLYPDIVDMIQDQINMGNERVFDILKTRYPDNSIEKEITNSLEEMYKNAMNSIIS